MYIPSVLNSLSQSDFSMFYLNTGTSLDINTGAFIPGISDFPIYKDTGQMYLDGGISPTFAIVGKSQTYKSAELLSHASRILRLCKDSFLFIYDTEFAIAGKQRILDLGSELDQYLPTNNEELKSRIYLENSPTFQAEEFFTTIQDITKERLKNKKDLLVETPFIDMKTGKKIKTMIPFIVVIDSLSKMQSGKEEELYEKHKLSDSETNLVYARDANIKAKLMRQLPQLAKKAGIYFLLSAHLGKKTQLNPFEPVSKDLQFMSVSETIKNVSSQFGFLTNTLLKSQKVTLLQNSKKDALYPPDFKVSPTELNLLHLVVCRCKNNISGTMISSIISQNFGLLEGINNYHVLKHSELNKELKLYGMEGSNIKQKLKLCEQYTLSTNKVRALISDNYELYRALEILSQIYHIYLSWPLNTVYNKVLNEYSILDISDMLVKNKSIKISDILNSRGYWTYDKKDLRKYLSVFDILYLLNKK